MSTIKRNIVIPGKHNKPILLDIGYQADQKEKPIIIFTHGFKGFKDWGHFNLVMNYFIEQGFAFLKFNFSHNGGTTQNPIDFPDLEAFGNNNYSKELDDLRTVVNWIENVDIAEFDTNNIYLIGHSRGGGISILAANKDSRIKKLVTWAAVSDFMNRLPKDRLPQWKKDGVIYIENTRTHQQMPMYYQFAKDLLENTDKLNIQQAAQKLNIPFLIIHGTKDEVVLINEAHQINQWNKTSQLFLIENSGHTFGAKHPFKGTVFPNDVKLMLDKTISFLL